MRGFAPRKHPAQSLQPGLHHKTTFCFSASTCRQDSHTIHFAPAGNCLSPTAGRHLSGRFFTEHHTFRPQLPPSRRQPATALRRIFPLSFFLSFSSIPLHAKKNRGQPAKPILLYFSYNSKSSPNLVQASPSQSLSLPFSPSSQYTLPHRPRSGHT